jgi:hypothetical protein
VCCGERINQESGGYSRGSEGTHFIKEKSVLEHALFREVIRQACVRGGKSAAELLSFVMEVGIDNVKVAKSLKDLEGNVHPTTMQSMIEYCERKHRNNEEKMLNAMVLIYEGRVSGGKIGGANTAKLLSFVMEVGINNVKVAKFLEDLEGNVWSFVLMSITMTKGRC